MALIGKDGGCDYTKEFATQRIDTGIQPDLLRKDLVSLRVLVK